jgi:hypothetical protein
MHTVSGAPEPRGQRGQLPPLPKQCGGSTGATGCLFYLNYTSKFVRDSQELDSGVTLYHGAPCSKAPPSRSAKCTSRAPYMQEFSRGPGLTRKMFESRLSEIPFPGLWEEILQNSDGQKTTL